MERLTQGKQFEEYQNALKEGIINHTKIFNVNWAEWKLFGLAYSDIYGTFSGNKSLVDSKYMHVLIFLEV
jgi:hypothetical protein